ASLVVTSLFFPERVAPPGPTLFPYTTLFRSGASASAADGIQQVGRHRPGAGQSEGSEESHSLLLGRKLRVGYPGLSASNPGRGAQGVDVLGFAELSDEKASFVGRQAAPDAVALAGLDGVGETLPPDRAPLADLLCLLFSLVDGEEDLEILVATGGGFEPDATDARRIVATEVLDRLGDRLSGCDAHGILRMPTWRRAETMDWESAQAGNHGAVETAIVIVVVAVVVLTASLVWF